MLTTTEIATLLRERPTRMWIGKLRAVRAQQARHENRGPGTGAQLALLDALIARGPVLEQTYAHPADHAEVTQARLAGERELTESDRVWLARLPEPGAVSWQDARALAALASSTPPRTADRRLVESVWAPVRERHDAARARVAVANAEAAWPVLPEGEVNEALRATIAAETSELTAAEVVYRGSDTVVDIRAARDAARDGGVAAARRHASGLDVAARERIDPAAPVTAPRGA